MKSFLRGDCLGALQPNLSPWQLSPELAVFTDRKGQEDLGKCPHLCICNKYKGLSSCIELDEDTRHVAAKITQTFEFFVSQKIFEIKMSRTRIIIF